MNKKYSNGFTLIELLVTLAIAAILGSIAVASYKSSVLKTKRAEGKTALLRLMQLEERYYTQNNSYLAFSKASNDPNFKWYSGSGANTSAYEIKAEACQGELIQNCVLLTAMPGTSNVDSNYNDSECGNYTLTSTGIKDVSISNAKDKCW